MLDKYFQNSNYFNSAFLKLIKLFSWFSFYSIFVFLPLMIYIFLSLPSNNLLYALLLFPISAHLMTVNVPLFFIAAYIFLKINPTKAEFNFDTRSGNGESSIIPAEIKKWNWGAAGLSWFWGVQYNHWRSMIALFPVINIAQMIYLGLKGNEIAWKNEKWTSVDAFNQEQAKWKKWGIFLFLIQIFFFLIITGVIIGVEFLLISYG